MEDYENEDEEAEEGGDEDEEDLYESDVSLAEDMDEQVDEAERAGGAPSASAGSDENAGAWARVRRGAASAVLC